MHKRVGVLLVAQEAAGTLAGTLDRIPGRAWISSGYAVILISDVLQYLANPEELLRDARRVLRPGGQVPVTVPDAVHWYPRLRFATGRFGYDRRGVLGERHLRCSTRATLRDLTARAGYDLLAAGARGLPGRTVAAAAGCGRIPGLALWSRFDRLATRLWPNLFAYGLCVRLTPHHEQTINAPGLADEVFGAGCPTVPSQLRGERTDRRTRIVES